MAEYYVDQDAYASALGAAPTWGVPQEGDGSSKDAATASAVAEIVFTANATASQTVTVCGVVFTAVASGATGNQFNVGAALTNTIDNLVAAINASSTAVGSSVAVGTPQLRNFVFARNTAGTTLQVMMRVGSAALNTANNSNCALNTTMSASSSLPASFAGGSGGCWGWLMNTSAIGVSSSIAALGYGVMVAALPMVAVSNANLNLAATPTLLDTIWARTKGGFTLVCASNTFPSLGTPNYSHSLVFDSNTVWTGDSGTGVVTVQITMTSTDCNLRLLPNTASQTKSVRCLRPGSLRFLWPTTTTGQVFLSPSSSGGSRAGALWDGVRFETGASFPTSVGCMRINGANFFCGLRMKRCSFVQSEARSTWQGLVTGTTIDGSIIFEGCEITVNHTAGADPGPIVNTGTFGASAVRLIGCSITGWSFGRHRVFASATFGSGTELVAEACTGIALGSSYANISASRLENPNLVTCVITSADAGLGYRYEYGAGVVDWNPDAAPAYPTRNALLQDNTTPWSVKMDWFAATVNAFSNLVTPRMGSINRLGNGVRTVALDFLTPVTVTARDVSMRVHYIGTDNVARCESTFGLASALTSPGATWAGIANYPSHSSRRLTLTTSAAVKQGTEVAVYFEVAGAPPGGSGVQLYIDPEVALS